MKRLIAPAALTALAALGTACGGSSSGAGATLQPQTSATSSLPASSTGGCSAVASAKPALQHYSTEPKRTIARAAYTVTFVTNCAAIKVPLNREVAALVANAFALVDA